VSEPGLIDWGLADRLARALAGNGSGKRSVRRADLQKASRGSAKLVRDYTGLKTRGRLPSAEIVDRREWIEANIGSLRAMSGGIEQSLAEAIVLPGPFGSTARAAAGKAAAVEVGLASAYLAQRVLGQYDVALVGPSRPPRLLFVAPNLAEAQQRLGAEREPFLRWIALHEATHAVQFGSVPWLRDYIGGMAEELLSGAFARIRAGELAAAARRALGDPRRLAAAVRSGEWMSPFVGRPRMLLMRRLQVTMSIVEGYSEHVMDAVGVELGPDYAKLRARVERNRDQRGLLEGLISRLLGLDLKMRQYTQGKAFCDEVAERRGIETLNRVWSEPGAMPRPSELGQPGRWISRVA
jgi:coenzyme F420 biosynthesis associated uncharacterized protein